MLLDSVKVHMKRGGTMYCPVAVGSDRDGGFWVESVFWPFRTSHDKLRKMPPHLIDITPTEDAAYREYVKQYGN